MQVRAFTLLFGLITNMALANAQGLAPLPTPRPAPGFELQDTHGKLHTLADYRGKVLIVNFWATWCSPCVKEMPSLQRAWQQLHQDNVQILAVNMGENRKDIDSFAAINPIGFPLLLDVDMALATAWSVKGLPTTYILDQKGQIVYQVLGDRDWNDPTVLQQVRALREPSQPL